MSDSKPGPADGDREQAFRDAARKVQALENAEMRAEHACLTPRQKAALLLMLLCIVAGWGHTFQEMWYRWFEAWHRTNWSLMDRLTKGDSYYTHGPIVAVVSLLIAWLIHRRVRRPVRCTPGSRTVGWTLLGLSLLAQLFAARAGVMFVSGFALIGVIGGLILLWGGWPLARAYWLPVIVLVFMVPLPMDTIAKLNFQLKFIATEMAVWLTNNVMAIPANMDGAYVYLPSGPDGQPKTLVVENICGGLRSMISLIFFAALFAVVCRVKGVWRWLMLVLAVPVAIASNVIRITSLNVVAYHFGVAAAGEEGDFHGWSGLLVFIVALGMLFGVEQLILWVGRRLRRDWSDPRLLGYLEKVRGLPFSPPRIARPLPLAAVAATAVLSLFWWLEDPRLHRGHYAEKAVPETVEMGGVTFYSERGELSELERTILQTDDYLYRRFHGGDRHFSVMIVFSPNNRKGTHPPDVCIEGGGSHIVSKRTVPLDAIPGRGPLRMRELVAQADASEQYFLYVYKCGRRYTDSYIMQQFLIFVNGLIDRNSAGALIRFDVPMRGRDVAAARQVALEAVEALMPGIDATLP